MSKHANNGGSAIYGLGLIGAAIYFIGQAVGFGGVVIGFLKTLIWPLFLVYYLFNFLGK